MCGEPQEITHPVRPSAWKLVACLDQTLLRFDRVRSLPIGWFLEFRFQYFLDTEPVPMHVEGVRICQLSYLLA